MKNTIPYFKSWYALLLLVCGLWSASPVWADVSEDAIQIEPDCVRVEVQDAPLPEVTKALSQESGIEIRLPDSLIGEFITTQLNAKDCSSVVLALLQDFSMMKFWGDDGHLVAVQLLSRKQGWVPEAATQEAEAPLSRVSSQTDREERPVHMVKALDQNQLQTLIKVGKGELSPWEVMYESKYIPYFHRAGLREPGDWEDKKKLATLRIRAQRAWIIKRQTNPSR